MEIATSLIGLVEMHPDLEWEEIAATTVAVLDLKEAKIPRFLSGGARVSDARTLFARCFGEEQYGRILYDLCMCHHAFCRVASVAAADRDIRIPTSKGHLLNNAMPLPAARRCAAGDSRTTTDTPAYGWSAQFDTAAARTPVRTT